MIFDLSFRVAESLSRDIVAKNAIHSRRLRGLKNDPEHPNLGTNVRGR